ncbi:ATP-dependent zinc metalloprotease FtsH [Fructilactobacillus fructivorans]|uniref:ATP-dependent zinc metalloprotease FtsH n=1 Tax=Fructilactobacillus fructivorans TaxID=1614 RepID=A0A0C1M3Z9_9LACO|nr:ATP-dependent zinc metalloprotease FtsH [Fructilactobacillus fructivorans]KID41024.1 Cell division protein FtsH [Fructilactobacillus fructivorans]KRK57360.1 ATP-dependent metalloprotease FtsH [Fructilactobacillus fructivorans]KRN12493.1 ATP-dependent metalloprotease FtsH [Fructilactobacillus fructivorans]KRN41011.1 ATP-dependent metalloprotease FtsH [Fructilactobacillus fructivorans]KRN43002.1 ATP-dependent metalloprotease FtsH [Fructilactobacillus fructivorans]
MKNNKNGLFKSSLFYIIIFVVVMGVIMLVTGGGGSQSTQTQGIRSSQFTNDLQTNKVKNFSVQPSGGVYKITGQYKKPQNVKQKNNGIPLNFSNGKLTKSSNNNYTKVNGFTTSVLKNDSSVSQITKLANKNKVPMSTKETQSNSFWLNLAISVLPLLIFIYLFYIMMKQAGGAGGGAGGVMKVGKSQAKPVKSSVKFSDVAGEDEEKQELVEVVEFLKDPKKFTKLGAVIPKGVLLEGPPGTGKTLLAKAVAGEANVPFYSLSGSDFVEMFVGVGASRVRDLFAQAKKNAPAIIFIDEIDAVGRKRGSGMGGGHDEREQTLNQLLVEMDGFTGNEGVIVIAATNRSDVLDPALTRPGRFDRKILVGQPDVRGREAILKVHAKGKPLAPDVDLHEIAKQTPGFVGADLANLLNEAALLAARNGDNQINAADMDEAEDRVIAGPAKRNKVINEHERQIVANHEAGHTIVGLVLNDARVVHKVTIVPRGRAGGYAIMLPKEDQQLISKKNAQEQLAGLMGGRTAEEVVFHSESSGASNDFEQATNLARAMVTQYGMSDKIGTVELESPNQDPYAAPKYSQETATKIDDEVKYFIDEAHSEAKKIIEGHREQHKAIADALLKYETLDEKEILSLYKTGKMPEHSENSDEYPSENETFEQAKKAIDAKEHEHEKKLEKEIDHSEEKHDENHDNSDHPNSDNQDQ